MFKRTGGEDRFDWRLPLYGALGALILFLPATVTIPDFSLLAYLFLLLVVSLGTGAFLLMNPRARKIRRLLSILTMLAAYWAVSAALVGNFMAIRTTVRWSLWSRGFKGKVLAEPTPTNEEFKHVVWDGWGWAGQDTTIYLIFDPADSLSAPARSSQAGEFRGIPCDVYRVRRLESHWYTARFYTNESWGRCN